METDFFKLAIASSISSIYKGVTLADKEFLKVTEKYSRDPVLSYFEPNRLKPSYVTLEFPFVITRNKNFIHSLLKKKENTYWTNIATEIVKKTSSVLADQGCKPKGNWSVLIESKLISKISHYLRSDYLKNHIKTRALIVRCLKYRLLEQCNGVGIVRNFIARIFRLKIPGFSSDRRIELVSLISKEVSLELSQIIKVILNQVLNDQTSDYHFICINTDKKKFKNKVRVARISIDINNSINNFDEVISNFDTQIVE